MITAPEPTTKTTRQCRIGLTLAPQFGEPSEIIPEPPRAGTGKCYACDCRGYHKGKETNWCGCGHHWNRHA